MVDTFHRHIQAALADEDLQIALDANAQKRISAQEQALVSLSEDWVVLRARAHKIRSSVVNHLDDYLDQFISQAESNGIRIHLAATADQAVDIVLGIAKENQAKLIAKSKTMVSEEIGLNHALEAAGYQVVETDLGEYIIQLRGEPPAHIITPAVHLRKEQVGETFKEKLKIPYTEDIATMTAAARAQLRQTFFNADIGVSGVNFGVAENGMLCLVTNEGNGRMVTTLPKVHIALMGIERLVPNMEDLDLMLQLLARSATGQKMTVYTTLISSPRKLDDPDGPEQRHLVLVDNGRRAMRDSPLAEGLLCIRCGACLNACPVFAEIGGHAYVNEFGETSTYPGPIGSIVSPGLFGQEEFGRFARASTLCGACKDACPVDIDLPKLLLRVRAGGVTLQSERKEQSIPLHVNFGLKIYTWMSSDAARFSGALRIAGWLSKVVSPKSSWLKLPSFTGWGYSKDLPRPNQRPFRERWASGKIEDMYSNNLNLGPAEERPTPNVNIQSLSDEEDLIQRFALELTALNGEFTLCKSQDLGARIYDQLQKNAISSVISWDDGQLPSGLIDYLRSKGIRVSHEFDPEIRAGISGAEAAVAETGTLVLTLEKGKPHFVSLIPEIHFAVLKASDIAHNLSKVFSSNALEKASMTALISGPSRTADIEMTLTIGVHGPGHVHVFCLDD